MPNANGRRSAGERAGLGDQPWEPILEEDAVTAPDPAWPVFRLLFGKRYGRGWRYGYIDGYLTGYEAARMAGRADGNDTAHPHPNGRPRA
jgi:hypothetical protein